MPDHANDGKTGEGRRWAVLRTARGLEQQDVATGGRVGSGAVSEIEQDRRTPEPATRERLLEALRCSVWDVKRTDWFLRGFPGGSDEPGSFEAWGRAGEGLALVLEDQARARVALRAAAMPPARHNEAREHWDVLKAFPHEVLQRLIEDSAALQTPAFLEILCAESEKVARSDPHRSVALAELALELAAWVPLADEQQRPEYQAWALNFVANARRVLGNLPGMKEALQKAATLWPPGSPARSMLDGTRNLDLRASALLAERRLPEAIALLDQALELGSRGPAARARILIKKAKAHEELKQHEVALELLEQAEPLLTQEPEPVFVHIHRTNVLVNLLALGRAEEAERRLGEVKALAAELGNDLDKLRLRWFEARLDAAFGRRLAAIATMREVRAGFQTRRIAYDTALATLELAELLLAQGETAEVKDLAEEMLSIFAEQEVPQEAGKALRIFCEAAIQETATVELVRRVLAEMAR